MLLKIGRMPVVLLFCAVLFWSAHNVVAKALIENVPAYSFTFIRWLLASFMLLPFTWSYLRQDWAEIKRTWKRLLYIAALGITAFNTMLYIAVETTTATNVGVISSIFPGMIALFSWLILKVSLTRVQLIGMLISFLGVILVIIRGELATVATLVFVQGDLWMVLAIIFGALYPVLLHDKPAMHPLSLLTMLIILGTITSIPLFVLDLIQGHLVELNLSVGMGLLFISLFPSIVAYLFWNRGIELIGANRAGLFLNLIPILTAMLAAVFLGEVLRWFHFAGLVLVVGGMMLFNLTQLQSLRDH
jgi:drug/metabolite transporter (DMT)-like permease